MDNATRPTIRPLPSLVVNKIAAGEVVERPASVVKELIENAVDSGATRIDVMLEKGGAELVRVVDNGRGILAEELPLAVTNHATSKITSAEELFEVGTLGFRGEALASIASVSRVTIRSRPQSIEGEPDAEGAELIVNGGIEEPVAPAGCPVGTTIEVRDLFYNTPVRQKFLRTAQTEAGHATEAFTRVALAHPSVHFTLTHNGRLLHDLPAIKEPTAQEPSAATPSDEEDSKEFFAGWRDRIAMLFGEELANGLIPVSSLDERADGGIVKLEGFVAAPTQSRSHTKLQYLLLNGRAIRDRSLQHALGEAYRGLLLTGRKPICFLRLTMPPALVDVNVHPMKLEVRFAESGPLYSQLLGTLRSKFLATDLRSGAPIDSAANSENEINSAVDESASDLANWAKRGLSQRRFDEPSSPMNQGGHAPSQPTAGGSESGPAGSGFLEPGFQESGPRSRGNQGESAFRPYPNQGDPLTLHHFNRDSALATAQQNGPSGSATSESTQPQTSDAEALSTHNLETESTYKAIQLHQRYLIVETHEGMEIIDQHALHERVLYEQLRNKILSGPLETQRLLVPEPVDLAPAEAAAVLEQSELFKKIGLEVQPFGGDTILVASVPALLRVAKPAEMLRDLANQLLESSKTPEARDLCDELLHMMSCKAAVKYGDPLTPEEVQALLAARPGTENHHHCPHGRPTSLLFSREELDRKFQRI